MHDRGFPGGSEGKRICLQRRRPGFDPWVGKIPWRRTKWQPTPLFLPGESHGHRRLAGYSPWVAKSQTRLRCMDSNEGSRCHGYLFLTFSGNIRKTNTPLSVRVTVRAGPFLFLFLLSSPWFCHTASTLCKFLGLLGFYSLFFFKLQALSLTCNLILPLGMNQMCRRVSL